MINFRKAVNLIELMIAISLFALVVTSIAKGIGYGTRSNILVDERMAAQEIASQLMTVLVDKVPYPKLSTAANLNTVALNNNVTITYTIEAPNKSETSAKNSGMFPGDTYTPPKNTGSKTVKIFDVSDWVTIADPTSILTSDLLGYDIKNDAGNYYIKDERGDKYYFEIKVQRLDPYFHYFENYMQTGNPDTVLDPQITDSNYFKTQKFENVFMKIYIRIFWTSKITHKQREYKLVSFKARL